MTDETFAIATGAARGRTDRRLLLGTAAFLLALAAISGAWAFEILGGFVPCALCLEQRVPYYVGLPLLALGLVLVQGLPRAGRVLFALGGLALLWSAGLGVYHAGAEWAFWQGPADCGGADATVRDASQLLAQIQSTRLVSCTEAAVRFLGLSFAGWNVLAATGAAGLAFAAALARGPGGPR